MGTSPLRYIDFFSFKSILLLELLTYTLANGRLSSGKGSYALGTPLLRAPDQVASFGSTGTSSDIVMVSSYG